MGANSPSRGTFLLQQNSKAGHEGPSRASAGPRVKQPKASDRGPCCYIVRPGPDRGESTGSDRRPTPHPLNPSCSIPGPDTAGSKCATSSHRKGAAFQQQPANTPSAGERDPHLLGECEGCERRNHFLVKWSGDLECHP